MPMLASSSSHGEPTILWRQRIGKTTCIPQNRLKRHNKWHISVDTMKFAQFSCYLGSNRYIAGICGRLPSRSVRYPNFLLSVRYILSKRRRKNGKTPNKFSLLSRSGKLQTKPFIRLYMSHTFNIKCQKKNILSLDHKINTWL